jgi:hypothetical protein
LTDEGCMMIADALSFNKTLRKCEIDNGDEDETNTIVNKECLATIASQCRRNASLSPSKAGRRDPSTFRRTTRQIVDLEKV